MTAGISQGPFTIGLVAGGRGTICRSILSDLPEWFGRPESVDAYVAAAETLPMLAAQAADGAVLGFLSLKQQTPAAVEAYVLGVHRAAHRQGIGRALFVAAGNLAASWGARYLTVKTLAPSHPDPHYRATRLFYEAIGFEPVEIIPEIWDAATPCLLMIKRIAGPVV